MSIFYCRITGKAVDGTLIIKDSAEYGTAYMNIMGRSGEFYQIHGRARKEDSLGGNLLRLNSIGGPNEVSYTINRFTKKVVFLGKNDSLGRFIEKTEGIKECNFGSNSLKNLPHPYSQKESAIIVGVGIIVLLVLYIIFRKYFFKKLKHKK